MQARSPYAAPLPAGVPSWHVPEPLPQQVVTWDADGTQHHGKVVAITYRWAEGYPDGQRMLNVWCHVRHDWAEVPSEDARLAYGPLCEHCPPKEA